jgi:hypothetical protein
MSRHQRQRENRELIERLRRDGTRIARHFGLRFRSIDAERANVKRRYGICYSDGTIRIRLRHATSGKPLRYSSLVNTLCHELAHLRHFNHGERFKRFYFELLGWSRQQGIYRPTRPLPATAGAPGSPALSPRPPLPPPAVRRPPPLRPRAEAPDADTKTPPQPEQLTLF